MSSVRSQENSSDSDASGGPGPRSNVARGRRPKFSQDEDLILVREVAAAKAYVAGYGDVKSKFSEAASRASFHFCTKSLSSCSDPLPSFGLVTLFILLFIRSHSCFHLPGVRAVGQGDWTAGLGSAVLCSKFSPPAPKFSPPCAEVLSTCAEVRAVRCYRSCVVPEGNAAMLPTRQFVGNPSKIWGVTTQTNRLLQPSLQC
jgi:hypothetical protein